MKSMCTIQQVSNIGVEPSRRWFTSYLKFRTNWLHPIVCMFLSLDQASSIFPECAKILVTADSRKYSKLMKSAFENRYLNLVFWTG